MRVLVCGGRDFNDRKFIFENLDKIKSDYIIECLISGGARGVDIASVVWARNNNIPVALYPITREDWQKEGNAAGPLRNARMLVWGKPDLVVVFPGRNGTADMRAQADYANIKIIDVMSV